MEALASAKMLKRMRVLEAEGVKFAAKPLRELQTAGCDGSFFDASAAGATLRAVVREGFLHPGAPAGAGVAAPPAASCASSKGARAARPVVHRLALLAESGAGIAAVVTQSDVIAFLHARVAALGSLADASVARLGLVAGAERLISVPPETAALDAMALMDARGISAVAVVAAADGRILGNFSVSELRSIVAEHFGSLALPVGEFLALEHGTEYAGYMSQPAAEVATPAAAGFLAARRASLGRKSSSGARPAGGAQRASMDGLAPSASMGRRASAGAAAAAAAPGAEVGQALVTCGPGATLREVLALLVERRLHRVYVVDAALRPVGVITLTDILRRLADEP
jgi:CBS domain-containing protein